MNYIILDLIVLAILLVFALLGMRKGLILSLFSLVAVLVSLAGALLVSNLFAPTVANWLEPALTPPISSTVQAALPEDLSNAERPAEQLLALLEDAELPFGLDETLTEFLQANTLDAEALVENLTATLVEKTALAIAYIVLFLLAFILILIIWHLISRTLNLVAKLPGLHALNKLGGFLFGAVRGALFLFILGWLLRLSSSELLPAGLAEQTTLLNFFMTVNPLDLLAKL